MSKIFLSPRLYSSWEIARGIWTFGMFRSVKYRRYKHKSSTPEHSFVERSAYFWVDRASSVIWFYNWDGNPKMRNDVLRSGVMIMRSSKDLENPVHKELLSQLTGTMKEHIYLHLGHLPPEALKKRLPCFSGIAAIFGSLLVLMLQRSQFQFCLTVHYNMGGIPTNYHERYRAVWSRML